MVRLPSPNLVILANIVLGCKIEYLPPYSPHLNPIELAFGVIKAHLRSNYCQLLEYENPYYVLHEAYSVITPQIAQNMMAHCGYW